MRTDTKATVGTPPEGLAHVLLDASWETKLWALVARAALNAGAISRLLDSRVDPRSLAYCSMSSGTTGAPKAYSCRASQLYAQTFGLERSLPI